MPRLGSAIVLLLVLAGLFGGNPVYGSPARVALVIGNGDYRAFNKLPNPANDAADMAEALRKIGFKVILEKDCSLRNMDKAVNRFIHLLPEAEVGLFYYAGHGIQVDGINYLLPVDIQLNDNTDINSYYGTNKLITKMRKANRNNLKVIILDACRDDPFAASRGLRRKNGVALIKSPNDNIKSGLAPIKSPSGTIVAFSTAAGETADDGIGRNSVYTKHLLKRIVQPGLDISKMFNLVCGDVSSETNGKQIPWINHSYIKETYLAGKNNFPSLPLIAVLASVLGGTVFFLLRPGKIPEETKQAEPIAFEAEQPAKQIFTPLQETAEKRPMQEKKAVGAVLVFGGQDIVLAPAPRQGIGRGERWPFAISDPHVSRRPHCWLGLEQGQFVLSRDGGEIIIGEEPLPRKVLSHDDKVSIGGATVLTVQRIIAGQAIFLEVETGPSAGKLLVMFEYSLPLADIFNQPLLKGRLKWEQDRLLISAPSPEQLPLSRKGLSQSELPIKNGDFLEIYGRQVAVRLLEEK